MASTHASKALLIMEVLQRLRAVDRRARADGRLEREACMYRMTNLEISLWPLGCHWYRRSRGRSGSTIDMRSLRFGVCERKESESRERESAQMAGLRERRVCIGWQTSRLACGFEVAIGTDSPERY